MTQKQWSQPAFVGLDILLINLAFYLSYVVRYEIGFPYPVDPQYDAPFFPSYLPQAVMLTVLCLLTYRINGLYERRRARRWIDETYRLVNGTMTSIVAIMAVTFFVQPLVYSRGMLVLAGLLIVAFLSAARLTQHWVEAWLRSRGIGVARVLIVGAGEVGRAVIRSLLGNPGLGYQIVGFVDDDPDKGSTRLGRIPGFGSLENMGTVIASERVDEVIVTLPWMYHRKIMEIVNECEREQVRVRVVPDVFQQRMRRIDIDSLNGIPLIGSAPARMSPTAVLLKRGIDLFLVLLASPILLIIFAVVGLAIKLDSPGPVFYKHRRVGKGGREFDMFKFRTMVIGADQMRDELSALNEADGPLFKIKDDPRRTRLGALLRRTSIDELPQIINVLRGEMSLVGPRAEISQLVSELQSKVPFYRARLLVKPGITGWAQVNFSYAATVEETAVKLEYDLYYIKHRNMLLDFVILLRTVGTVVGFRGQ
jgi:exopolysaccharide biosynthesis polyprenyl glycosylphosphotransferase